MRSSIIFFGLLSLLLLMHLKWKGIEAVSLKLSNAVCESYNKSLLIISECRIRAINREKRTFSFNATLPGPIFQMKARIQSFKRANGFKPWLYAMEIDICRFLSKPYNPFAIFLYRQFKEYTNFKDHRCPLVGIKTVDNYYHNLDNFKLPVETGVYLVSCTWFFNNNKMVTAVTNITTQVVEDLNSSGNEKSLSHG